MFFIQLIILLLINTFSLDNIIQNQIIIKRFKMISLKALSFKQILLIKGIATIAKVNIIEQI